MLAAQGFQESQLDQNAKSHVGAIGVMQVMPATGAELKVGDVRAMEPNIHAGAKYMDQLMTRYFRDATLDEQNRTLFAFAAYNSGPGNLAKMRKEVMDTVDRELGPIARPGAVHFVTMLPKTRSGKLLRRSIQALAEGRDPGDLTTIEDPGALEQIRAALAR